jgi:DNA-binding response OmpR family regulator
MKRILSVSYNEALLRTREMLLQHDGHSVVSALGFTDAVERCKDGNYGLFILGHSIPEKDKRELIRVFRAHCPAPILGLQRPGENASDQADDHIDPNDIEALLNAVRRLAGS